MSFKITVPLDIIIKASCSQAKNNGTQNVKKQKKNNYTKMKVANKILANYASFIEIIN